MSATLDGQALRHMVAAGTAWLERHAAAVNALNVFPVPDGDTGTNMLLTARAAHDEVAHSQNHHAGEMAQRIYRGAQFGSRGNSGVILSQLLRGYASALKDKTEFTGHDWADALRQASVFAYQGVTKPVEGTILTVAREAGDAAMLMPDTATPQAVMEQAVKAADDAVARTPQYLKVLRDAGVVDSGGQGYYYFLEGMARYLRGETTYIIPGATVTEPQEAAPAFTMDFITNGQDELEGYGYCTEFIVEGQLNFDQFRTDMLKIGSSAVVVGDDEMIKVHIHTPDPGAALSYATARGSLVKVKIDNMDRQFKDFSARPLGEGRDAKLAEAATPAAPPQPQSLHTFAIVAVAPGAGFDQIFHSMGASEVIAGGQTMNPSVQDVLKAINSVAADDIIVLPNNKNVIMTAQQVPELTDKRVYVVPSKTIPQGIAAMLAIRHDLELTENVEAMTDALGQVQTVELAHAVRSVLIDDVDVKEGQILGILNDEVVTAGEIDVDVTLEVLARLGIEDYEVLSVYYGQDRTPQVARDYAEALAEQLRDRYDMPVAVLTPEESRTRAATLPFGTLRLEIHAGGQPHYFYVMSVE